MATIGFIFLSLISAFSIWSYRYAKKREAQGIVVMPPSKANIGPMILSIVGAVVCFLHATGLWEIITEWLQSGRFD